MSFADILVQKGIISTDELANANTQVNKLGLGLEEALVIKGVKEGDITEAKGQSSGVPVKKISKGSISTDILKFIPEESARHYRVVPLGIKEGVLEVGTTDPNNISAREAVQFLATKLNLSFKIFLISQPDFDSILSSYKDLSGEVTKVLGELEEALSDVDEKEIADIVSRKEEKEEKTTKRAKIVEEAPVTKIVAVILRHATEGNASDIHIEPLRDKLKIRFREDGILYTSLILPLSVSESVVSRIKILSNMRIDEKRKPQDGRFSAKIANKEIDFRVSTFPTYYGEKVVIRILDPEKGIKTLSEVGFSGRNLEIVRKAIKSPFGMILLTGPTGSGKTTTLYAMLQSLDREKKNIVSLEDPVEYTVSGMSQSQVRPELGYDFASGLRSILRQDPDIIMIGEIRDKETARLAIQAALTGHLVFSTLHTNSAVGVIPRLVDMGVDPFLIAPTLLLSIAQRLVQTLCPESRKEIKVTSAVKEKLKKEMVGIDPSIRAGIKIPDKIYQALPSANCPRGTRGRTAVFEIFEKTPEVENIILTNPVEPEILKAARKSGMLTMREDGLMKVFDGLIGFESIYEV